MKKSQHNVKQTKKLKFKCIRNSKHSIKKHKNVNLGDKKKQTSEKKV